MDRWTDGPTNDGRDRPNSQQQDLISVQSMSKPAIVFLGEAGMVPSWAHHEPESTACQPDDACMYATCVPDKFVDRCGDV